MRLWKVSLALVAFFLCVEILTGSRPLFCLPKLVFVVFVFLFSCLT